MALSKRIRAFSGVVLFLSVLPAAYLIGEMRGAQEAKGTTDRPETQKQTFKPIDRLELPKQLNQAQANPSGTTGKSASPGAWQVNPANTGLLPSIVAPFSSGDPFAQMEAEMQAMHKRMDDLFGQPTGLDNFPSLDNIPALGNLPGFGAANGFGTTQQGLGGLQMAEENGNYVVRCQAEGLDKGSLKVNVDDQTLTVTGQCTRQTGNASVSSSVTQMATLPGPVDPKTLQTDIKDGTVVITIAKAPSNASRSYSASQGGAPLH